MHLDNALPGSVVEPTSYRDDAARSIFPAVRRLTTGGALLGGEALDTPAELLTTLSVRPCRSCQGRQASGAQRLLPRSEVSHVRLAARPPRRFSATRD